MIIRIKSKEEAQIWGVVVGSEVKCDPELERLGPQGWSALLRKERQWRDAPEYLVQAAIRKGALPGLEIGKKFHSITPAFGQGQNRIVKNFFEHLFDRMEGSPSADQTLAIEYFAAGTNYATATDPNDTQLVNEVYRKVPSQIYDNSLYQITVSTHILSTEWNLTNTTVSSATTPTVTAFSVADASALLVGDAIEVVTPLGPEDCTITAKSGNDLTIYALNTANNQLPAAPVSGAAVYRKLGEWGCFMGTNATSTPNSGALVNRKLEMYTKTNAAGVLVDSIFSFQPSGT